MFPENIDTGTVNILEARADLACLYCNIAFRENFSTQFSIAVKNKPKKIAERNLVSVTVVCVFMF